MNELKRATSLRFFFALWVFLSHCDFIFGDESWIYNELFSYGYIGVGFFFVLSGFILSYVYKSHLVEGAISFREFLLRRFFRLYPLYLVTLLLTIPFKLDFFTSEYFSIFLIHAGMLQSFFPQEYIFFAFNSPSWSVSNEMFFYLLFPLFILYFRKAMVLFAILILAAFLTIPGTVLSDKDTSHYFFYINPVFRLCDFAFGIVLFRIYEKGIYLPRYSTLVGLALFVVAFLFKAVIPESLLYAIYFYVPIGVIILAAADDGQSSFVDSVLANRVLVYLGKISYGIYLFHIIVLRYIPAIEREYYFEPNPYLNVLICLIILIAISSLSFELFEKPLNKTLRKAFLKKQNDRDLGVE